jgi:hypothetical protein
VEGATEIHVADREPVMAPRRPANFPDQAMGIASHDEVDLFM